MIRNDCLHADCAIRVEVGFSVCKQSQELVVLAAVHISAASSCEKLWVQERMKDSQKQLDELTKKMAKLAQEKAELESRNRILEHVVRLNVDHVEELSSNQACSHCGRGSTSHVVLGLREEGRLDLS